jgi:hypothetical protein
VTRRLALVVAWLVGGHAVLAGLYVWLLQVPESSAWMLTLSALLALAVAAGMLVVQSGALLLWTGALPVRRAAATGARRSLALVPAVVLFGLVWWLGSRLDGWHASNRGPIDASMMARFNWAETGAVHRVVDWAVFALRYVIGGSLTLALAAIGVQHLFSATGRALARALHPRTLALVAGAELLLIVLPLHHVYWRPGSLPPTGAEMAFVTAKLSVITLLVATGWALLLLAGTRAASSSAAPTVTPPVPRSTHL